MSMNSKILSRFRRATTMDDHDEEIPWGELHVEEIVELLQEYGLELTDDALHQLAALVKQAGSPEEAFASLDELDRKAA